ncbi:TPA: hypothetical protein N0F65_012866 [Lagenidium giganteum]|uniref:CHCH domain-containing protein n=1 Tax=Lagenidium giganteum TaxID=4803 RepID=A0AAV2YK44_9STRA|nr:TPA: hypothetical protein N0F65_012866 [Lagenidium giganteum]
MARSRRSAPAPARKPAPAAPAAPKPAPAPVAAAPAAAPPAVQQPAQSGGMMSGLMGTMVEGMAWGTGTAVARHAVNAVVDSFSSDSKDAPAQAAPAPAAAAPVQQTAPACYNDQKAFMDCLNTNGSDISACQFYLDALNTCKSQAAYM